MQRRRQERNMQDKAPETQSNNPRRMLQASGEVLSNIEVKMEKGKIRSLILAAVFLAASMSCSGGLNSITEDEYLKAYFNMYQKYIFAAPSTVQLTDSKNNILDLIEYYLTTRAELSDFLWQKGSNSGRQIRTILDMANAPCVCDVNAACQATGDVCCCHQVQGVCDTVQVGLPKQWKSTNNCANGCCGDYCCGQEPTTNCYSNKQCYLTKGPCQACQKAGQDCVYEANQCNVDADCAKYQPNWICSTFNCCVPPQGTTTSSSTTSTTLAGCRSDKQCVVESGPCFVCPSWGSACTLQSNQCTSDSQCVSLFGKGGASATCSTTSGCCSIGLPECSTNTDCETIYGPHWACVESSYCTYYGTNTACTDGTKIGACNSGQERCMDGPYGNAILYTDSTYC